MRPGRPAQRRQLWDAKWDAALAVAWSTMDTAPHDRPVLLLFSGASNMQGCILAQFSASGPGGLEWKVLGCGAWFAGSLFAGWRDPFAKA